MSAEECWYREGVSPKKNGQSRSEYRSIPTSYNWPGEGDIVEEAFVNFVFRP